MLSNIQIENYINLEDEAERLGVKSATVRIWIKSKDLPAHRIGKLWKFKRTVIDEWVNSGKSAIE